MSSTVGIVIARPETLADDYRRVVELAGIAAGDDGAPPRLVTIEEGGDPGFGSPPWQRSLTRQAWGAAGDSTPNRNIIPERIRQTGQPIGAGDRDILLLPVPRLVSGWGVFNAVALWAACRDFLPGDPRRRESELAATLEAAGPRPRVLCDAVLWGSGGGTMQRDFIMRNVLLAGDDPVAVDSVAMHLAGMAPRSFPWLTGLQGAGVGICDLEAIRVKGDTDLLDDPFGGRHWSGTAAWKASPREKLVHLAWSSLRRRKMRRRFAATPWGRLASAWS
ncbi:hypothetical protein GW813_02510 [bacterium]|nr:hypothetical protein [bacterium]PIV81384.1 MAG: hypothetical protein COW53_04655 [bacterium CG17_big_fil_post_rev_8_21_14_2_50_64_8]PJA73469.1 MAG: hypothetical protein CO151_13175 [bacterium CG_4_9_14_3_um_filter_65_15]